jgi:hypothetical protein
LKVLRSEGGNSLRTPMMELAIRYPASSNHERRV